MSKADDIPDEIVEAYLSAVDRIDPFGREDLSMSPQQFRRHRVKLGLHAAILAEREACAQVVCDFPQTIALSEEDAAQFGMFVRQANRADLAAAIRSR